MCAIELICVALFCVVLLCGVPWCCVVLDIWGFGWVVRDCWDVLCHFRCSVMLCVMRDIVVCYDVLC